MIMVLYKHTVKIFLGNYKSITFGGGAMRQFIGKIVKHDVVNGFGVTVLPAGIVLREEHVELLEKHSVDFITVERDVIEHAPPQAKTPRAAVSQVVERAKALYES